MIYIKVKNDLEGLMKSKSKFKDFIKVVIAEFDRVGKDLTDEQCIAVMKKLHKNAVALDNPVEIAYLEGYLPKLMSEDEIETIIAHYIDTGVADNIGMIMKEFNKEYAGAADNRTVAKLAKQALNK